MRCIPYLVGALCLASPILAQRQLAQNVWELAAEARRNDVGDGGFRSTRVQGASLRDNLRRLTRELSWATDLEDAFEASKQAEKPLFLVHALGDLKGFT